MVPVSMVDEEVMLSAPPLMILPKSTEPALMVRSPVDVTGALPVILPVYQLPEVLTGEVVVMLRAPMD